MESLGDLKFTLLVRFSHLYAGDKTLFKFVKNAYFPKMFYINEKWWCSYFKYL